MLEQAHNMQTKITDKPLFSFLLWVIFLLPHKSACQTAHAEVARGLSANGIYAELQVSHSTNEFKATEITVSAIDSKSDMIFGEGHLGTNWIESSRYNISHNTWRYFQATNSFCGPVELTDEAGRKIPLTHATISSSQAYPETFSLRAEWFRHFFSNNPLAPRLGPMIFPLPLISGTSKLAVFQLKDYFDVRQAGQYELTVWPKIYKRSATNSDICDRVDLPPVSIGIRLE
jgi:hypothetical protein